MFRALFAHHQEAMHTQQLVYFVSISGTPTLLAASRHNMHKIYQLLYMQCLLMMSK
jgi:hypothetical protein